MKKTFAALVVAAATGCATTAFQASDRKADEVEDTIVIELDEDIEDPQKVADSLLDKVVVQEVDLDLDKPQKREGEHLWTFANTPYDRQFDKLTVKNWFANCERYKARILSLAESRGFDTESLRVALAGLNIQKKDNRARIPVGASIARKGTEKVWIIVLKWENADLFTEDREKPWLEHWGELIHIEVVAIRMKDGEKIDSVRCG